MQTPNLWSQHYARSYPSSTRITLQKVTIFGSPWLGWKSRLVDKWNLFFWSTQSVCLQLLIGEWRQLILEVLVTEKWLLIIVMFLLVMVVMFSGVLCVAVIIALLLYLFSFCNLFAMLISLFSRVLLPVFCSGCLVVRLCWI